MEPKDKIEIALRAGMVASDILELSKSTSKLTAKLILNKAVNGLIELDSKIELLPED
jgi:hypothetical protein